MDCETTVLIKMEPNCDDLFPKKAHNNDAAYDLFAAEDVLIYQNEVIAIPVGFKMALKHGWEAQIRPRSGLALKQGIMVVNSPGTIDEGYRGIVKVIVKYTGILNRNLAQYVENTYSSTIEFTDAFEIRRGDRIAQMVISRIPSVLLIKADSLPDSDRGEKGFGSTGN